MKKALIAGLATIAIAGSALIATGIYAANTTNMSKHTQGMNIHRIHSNPQDMIATLSGKVSPEALSAFQALITKHKTEMDANTSSTGTIDQVALQAQHTAFKTEMDTLLVQYPELKTAMPSMDRMKGRMGRGNGEIEAILATLPATVQAQFKSIRDSYQSKEVTLRTEEKTQIDGILSGYPEIKAKLDEMEKNRPQMNDDRGNENHGPREMMR